MGPRTRFTSKPLPATATRQKFDLRRWLSHASLPSAETLSTLVSRVSLLFPAIGAAVLVILAALVELGIGNQPLVHPSFVAALFLCVGLIAWVMMGRFQHARLQAMSSGMRLTGTLCVVMAIALLGPPGVVPRALQVSGLFLSCVAGLMSVVILEEILPAPAPQSSYWSSQVRLWQLAYSATLALIIVVPFIPAFFTSQPFMLVVRFVPITIGVSAAWSLSQQLPKTSPLHTIGTLIAGRGIGAQLLLALGTAPLTLGWLIADLLSLSTILVSARWLNMREMQEFDMVRAQNVTLRAERESLQLHVGQFEHIQAEHDELQSQVTQLAAVRTERDELRLQLAERRRDLDHEWGDWMTLIAHDLSGEMQNITLAASALLSQLRDGAPPEQLTHIAQMLNVSTSRFDHVLPLVLEFARHNLALPLRPNLQKVALVPYMHQMIMHEQLVMTSELALTLGPPSGEEGDVPDETTIVNWDIDRVEKVVTNLLTNAEKYNRRHLPIEIHLWHSAGAESIGIEVRDRGQGMAPEVLAHLFEPFYNKGEHVPGPRVKAGYGLGMIIIQRLVIWLGGEISVESKLGEGTCVHMRFPRMMHPAPQEH